MKGLQFNWFKCIAHNGDIVGLNLIKPIFCKTKVIKLGLNTLQKGVKPCMLNLLNITFMNYLQLNI